MRLTYIGTGAADWIAASGARDGVTRRFTCTLLDDAMLMDLAPTTPHTLFDTRFGRVTDILYTHSHNDHFDRDTLASLAAVHPVRVWAETHFAARIGDIPGVELHPLTPGQAEQVGHYSVLPLRANHALSAHPEEQALHYIISDGTRRIFWGADGAWLPTETWRAIRAHRPFDRMILDGTLGTAIGDSRIFEHNNLGMVCAMRDAFTEAGCLAPEGEIWLTHLSRDSHDSPVVLAEQLAKEQLHVAFDNMEDVF